MQCPTDGATLVMSERSGIEIDYCPQCRGVWLDRGELDKIVERLSTAPWAKEEEPEFERSARDISAKEHRKKKRKGFLEEMFDFG
jgi:Zn-finger nucleic acid-binding protein